MSVGNNPTPTLASFFKTSKILKDQSEDKKEVESTPSSVPISIPKPEPVDVVINVDVNRDEHPISPLIYGVSAAPKEVLNDLRPTLNSWGGNPSTRYNWVIGHAWNAGSDWFYRNGNFGNPEGSASDKFIEEAADAGIEVRIAYPALGWVAKDDNNNTCSFPQPDGSCGNANGASCVDPGLLANPNRANVPSDSSSIIKWMQHLFEEQKYKIRFLAFDNEPELWGTTHYDVHPTCTTYDEILSKYLEYSTAVHQVAPEAELVGPVTCCWWFYWNSAAGEADKIKHNNQDFLPWFLDSVRQHDEEKGWRSLDVLDIHFYPQDVYNEDVDQKTSSLRLRSTRSLWDDTYIDETWIKEPIYLIPRMQQLIEDHYPGTKLGISEWNWGAESSMNGALAIADVLGVFGKVELYYAAYWTYPAIGSPGYNAFKMYTNYDGTGSRFGDISVWAESSDSENITSYAAIDSTSGNLHVMIINKSATKNMETQIMLGEYAPSSDIKMYRYDNDNPKKIISTILEDVNKPLKISIPAYSITLLVFRASK